MDKQELFVINRDSSLFGELKTIIDGGYVIDEVIKDDIGHCIVVCHKSNNLVTKEQIQSELDYLNE